MYNKINDNEKAVLFDISKKLEIHPFVLYILINFESGWNKDAKNPLSSARGLIQIIDSTARALGFSSSLDAVNKNNTIILQLKNIVLPYLYKLKPFPSAQSLFMAVFYPRYRYVDPDTIFPKEVQKYNAGITSPKKYMEKVLKTIGLKDLPVEVITPLYNVSKSINLIMIIIPILIYYYLK